MQPGKGKKHKGLCDPRNHTAQHKPERGRTKLRVSLIGSFPAFYLPKTTNVKYPSPAYIQAFDIYFLSRYTAGFC
jgi:hypothetical protein